MKNLKFIAALMGIALLCMTSTFAQQRPVNPRPGPGPRPGMANPRMEMERLESAKIGFLTQKLDLSPREAEKFWPVYNQYQKELRALAKERMASAMERIAERKTNQQRSADEHLNEQMEMESRMLEIRKKYTREFSKVISSEKVLHLYEAEKEFRRELIKRLQERRKQ